MQAKNSSRGKNYLHADNGCCWEIINEKFVRYVYLSCKTGGIPKGAIHSGASRLEVLKSMNTSRDFAMKRLL